MERSEDGGPGVTPLRIVITLDETTLAWIERDDPVKVHGEIDVQYQVIGRKGTFVLPLAALWEIIHLLTLNATERMNIARSGDGERNGKHGR